MKPPKAKHDWVPNTKQTQKTINTTKQPVEFSLEGDAAVHQSAVFAVCRPLADCAAHFEVSMHHGRQGVARLVLSFSYSLVQLLVGSPQHPGSFEEWRLLKKDRLPGLHVRPKGGLFEAIMGEGGSPWRQAEWAQVWGLRSGCRALRVLWPLAERDTHP
jgi:hypothetical protein